MRSAACLLVLLVVSASLVGCTSHSNFRLSDEILFNDAPAQSPLRVGIYISPETKAALFDQCEDLIGGSQCYHCKPGEVLEPNALRAYSQLFKQAVPVQSVATADKVTDIVVELSYKSYVLNTTLDGVVAYRTVTVELVQDVYKNKKQIQSKVYKTSTACKAYQCQVDGKAEGLGSAEVVLNTLFTPGYIGGYGDRLAGIVNTAFSASLKMALVEAAEDLKRL